MCALVFEPGGHAKAIETFRPGFEAFCHAMPLGAKLHFTDAFKPGNEAWGKVAAEVRKEYVAHVNTVRPMIVYSARRLRLARDGHARDQMLIAAAQAAKHARISGSQATLRAIEATLRAIRRHHDYPLQGTGGALCSSRASTCPIG